MVFYFQIWKYDKSVKEKYLGTYIGRYVPNLPHLCAEIC